MNRPLTVSRPPANEGLTWLKQGWAWFASAPIPWMGMAALGLLALELVSAIPFLGNLSVVLVPFLVAGFMSATRAADEGKPVTFLHLGAGFGLPQHRHLLAIGFVSLITLVAIFYMVLQIAGEDALKQLAELMQKPDAYSPEQAEAIFAAVQPALLVGLLLLTPLTMATQYAPALVLFEGFSFLNALWWSIWAFAVNWKPMFVYMALASLPGALAMMIPYRLGLLVFLPWALCSTYAAYQAIFRPGSPA